MVDSPDALHCPHRIRHAGAELLSLALIDARNHTLRWLAAFEPALQSLPSSGDVHPPLWWVGHAAWFQEFWVARSLQRRRRSDRTGTRLASIDPRTDAWFDPQLSTPAQRWQMDLPDAQSLRHYLAETLDTTLELLSHAGPGDEALHPFRLALRREDQVGCALAVAAQALQLALPREDSPLPPVPAQPQREPLWFGAQRFVVGSPAGGLVPPHEHPAHEEALLEFEIDAHPVTWARYAEFVTDGGYDDAQWWSAGGWAWLQAQARRSPRYVEQMRHGVLLQRQGQLQRVDARQAALHVSWHEAQAWCRWAGRRLPAEVEWECAAVQGASRGWRCGDVFEWVAGSARAWPGFDGLPAGFAALPDAPSHKVLRGACFASRERSKHPRSRRFALPQRDELFCGFRSCAL